MTDVTSDSNKHPSADSPASSEPAHGAVLEHEYDGIREYDNPLPGWWVKLFWGSFVFAIGYFIHYQLADKGESVEQAYASEMRDAREREARLAVGDEITEAGLTKLVANPSILADAKLVFTQRCSPCHADQGQGKIGPNLTDNAWIHGAGTLMDIYGVVGNGVPAKGMPAWNRQLTPIELSKVVAYVGSIRGRNVPGKAPEGTPLARLP
jgi:cytochrome c oxidase cbb3-type subunit 3